MPVFNVLGEVIKFVDFESVKLSVNPYLCDHVLLKIFANLDLEDLYNVSQCSSRFKSLALRSFGANFSHRCMLPATNRWSISNLSTRSVELDIWRMFGPIAKAVEVVLKEEYSFNVRHLQPLPWLYFRVENLHTIKVDVSQIIGLCQRNTCFVSLKHLTLLNSSETVVADNIDYNRCFPILKTLCWFGYFQLNTNEDQLPRSLETLELCRDNDTLDTEAFAALLRLNTNIRLLNLDDTSMELNNLIDFMVTCGLHLTLEHLEYADSVFDPEDIRYELSDRLPMFTKLKTLRIYTYADICIYENSLLLQQLRNLECLTIDSEWERTPREFLMKLADNVPPTLTEFSLETSESESRVYHDLDVWRQFVAVMPSKCECNIDGISERKILHGVVLVLVIVVFSIISYIF